MVSSFVMPHEVHHSSTKITVYWFIRLDHFSYLSKTDAWALAWGLPGTYEAERRMYQTIWPGFHFQTGPAAIREHDVDSKDNYRWLRIELQNCSRMDVERIKTLARTLVGGGNNAQTWTKALMEELMVEGIIDRQKWTDAFVQMQGCTPDAYVWPTAATRPAPPRTFEFEFDPPPTPTRSAQWASVLS